MALTRARTVRHSAKSIYVQMKNRNCSSFVQPRKPPLSVYIHWPFCSSICGYCNFNRYLFDHSKFDLKVWTDSFLSQLRFYHSITPSRPIHSIFFGGGTPSLAPPEFFERILAFISSHWGFDSNSIEITLEANPTSVETQRLRDYRQCGINRISLGIQSLLESELRYLERTHSTSEALEAISIAHSIFPRVSIDLIYARHPQHTVSQWKDELRRAISLGTGHMSCYALTIEPGTSFHRKRVAVPESDSAAEFYEATVETLREGGLYQYEVSNFARSGTEQSLHNLNYWRSGDWIGCGPGAEGRITLDDTRESFIETKNYVKWVDAVKRRENGADSDHSMERKKLSVEDRVRELFLNGLRTTEGVQLRQVHWHSKGTKQHWSQVLNESVLKQLCKDDFIEWIGGNAENSVVKVTPHKGLVLLDSLLPSLLL